MEGAEFSSRAPMGPRFLSPILRQRKESGEQGGRKERGKKRERDGPVLMNSPSSPAHQIHTRSKNK